MIREREANNRPVILPAPTPFQSPDVQRFANYEQRRRDHLHQTANRNPVPSRSPVVETFRDPRAYQPQGFSPYDIGPPDQFEYVARALIASQTARQHEAVAARRQESTHAASMLHQNPTWESPWGATNHAPYIHVHASENVVPDAQHIYSPQEAASSSSEQVNPTRPRSDSMVCTICQDSLSIGVAVAELADCSHWFHVDCISEWAATTSMEDRAATCPTCRTPVTGGPAIHLAEDVSQEQMRAAALAAALHAAVETPLPASPDLSAVPARVTPSISHSVSSEERSAESSISARSDEYQDTQEEGESEEPSSELYPWWPAEGTKASESSPYYHASTALDNGRLSIIVDPGAWTNLWGSDVARAAAERSAAAGHQPVERKLPQSLNVSGVGKGAQKCETELTVPIGITTEEGPQLHSFAAPVISGESGREVPGLLGLRSLERERAILDCGNRMLHFVGPAGASLTLPPGSRSIPLEKAPSGHLVMVIDAYENQHSEGGIKPHTINLHADAKSRSKSNKRSKRSRKNSKLYPDAVFPDNDARKASKLRPVAAFPDNDVDY